MKNFKIGFPVRFKKSRFPLKNCVSFTLWTLFGDLIGSKFRNERYSKILNNTFSLLLLLVAFWMFKIEISF